MARLRASALTTVLVAVLGGCGQGPALPGADAGRTTLHPSTTYAVQAAADAPDREDALRAAVDDLRAETGSGWVGRQDDVTGYLAGLSGGRWFPGGGVSDPAAVVTAFAAAWGPRLLGVGAEELAPGPPSAPDASGSVTVRAAQVRAGVPVLDGELVVTVGDADGQPRVNAVQGRVFPGVDATTEPEVPADRAAEVARAQSGGQVQGTPELVLLPEDGGRLVWRVTVVGAGAGGRGLVLTDGDYLVDALTGRVAGVRAASAHGRTAVPRHPLGGLPARAAAAPPRPLEPDPASVQVTGTGPTGDPLTAHGVRAGDGVLLVDTTVPSYDPATQEGAILTYDARGSADERALPGRLVRSRGTTVTDPEAIAAHALSRVVHDYYTELGRLSWDGVGGSLVSTVNFGDATFCNAFFSDSLQPPQMVYGNPCAPGGVPAETSTVEIDTAGHEITHGVTATSSGLIYSGQSGALNESFSDYFGNVIGNAHQDSDSAALFETGCAGITTETPLCTRDPEGGLSLRYLLNGNTFEDYLNVLNPTYRLRLLGVDAQDQGGVHLNSAIWNNALWSIRTRLAQLDGTSGNDSPLARQLDEVVYDALTTGLAPAAGFLDARAAIERSATGAGVDPEVLRVVRETFDENLICAGCASSSTDPATTTVETVSSSPQTQLAPVVSGDRVAWLDLARGDGVFGFPAAAGVGDLPASLAATPETAQVAFAGESLLALELPGRIVRYDEDGTTTRLARVGLSTLAAGLAGSDEGAAWQSSEDGTVSFVGPTGPVTSARLPRLGGDTVVSVGTGGGTVALGTDGGRVLTWRPGGRARFVEVARLDGAVLAVAVHGRRVLAIDDAGTAAHVDGDDAPVVLSEEATPFGAAVNEEYAVWAEAVGVLGGGVAETEGAAFPDTDLHLFSPRTGSVYDLLPQRGQQGFPAISGDRLVWQDSVLGGDDILTATLPGGL